MFFSRISVKIGIWYAGVFFLGAVVMFGLTAYLLMASLQDKDRDLLNEKLVEYSTLYARDGISGLRYRVSGKEIKNARNFVVRLADHKGNTLFIHSPDRSGDANAPQLTDIDKYLILNPAVNGFIVIPGRDFGDNIEMVSKKLPSGETLQVGKDTEDREVFLSTFAQAYLKGLAPTFLLALFIGVFLSHRLLKPIRRLTQTVKNIHSGQTKARVELHKGRDELWYLGNLFNEMLEQNQRLVQGMKDTVDNVAHDLRTPIMRLQNAVEGAMQGQAEVLRLQDALMDCKENSDLILKLIDGIMDISEAEAGTLKLKKELVDSHDVIDSVIDLYSFIAEDKKIEIKSNIHQAFFLIGDRMRLIQVLSNLVDNAIKYSPSGSAVLISSSVDGEWGEIVVSDQGYGIPESEIPYIWDRLYRSDTSRSSRGLGLGLSLVKAIVLAHGGTVHAASPAAEAGTSISIKFKITKM